MIIIFFRTKWPERDSVRKFAEPSGFTFTFLQIYLLLSLFRTSSFFYCVFMVKNILEILLAIVFVFYNSVWLWAYDFSEKDEAGLCDIDLLKNNVAAFCKKLTFSKLSFDS